MAGESEGGSTSWSTNYGRASGYQSESFTIDDNPVVTSPEPVSNNPYAQYGEGRAIAERLAGYGVGAAPKSDWQVYTESMPQMSITDTAKTVFSFFTSPVTTIAQGIWNADSSYSKMSEAQKNNFATVRSQIEGYQSQRTGGSGNLARGTIESVYGLRSSNSGVSGGVSSGITGSGTALSTLAENPEKTGAQSAGATDAAGGVVAITQGESQWGKWAALATVAGVLYQIFKG